MKLKESPTGPGRHSPASLLGRIRPRWWWVLTGLTLMVVVSLVPVSSTHHRVQLYRILFNRIYGLTGHPEHIQIGVKFTDYQKLGFKREQALQKGILISSSEDFVPARIRLGERECRARMRLKGDWTYDNLKGEKWSFRVILRNDSTLFGMRQFSLHQPPARNNIHEWIFHKALAGEDIIPLRTRFVRVSLNGKDLGIYALEEHFEKRLIEHNRRREGVIIKFDENLRWKDVREFYPHASLTGLSSMFVTEIDAFKSGRVMADSSLRAQFLLAHNLLESFRTGDLPAGQVLDVEKTAAYFALVDLFGGGHALSYHNLRFYYNPISSRLEPVGFDAMAGYSIQSVIAGRTYLGLPLNPFVSAALADDEIVRAYIRSLERLAHPEYLDSLLARHEEEIDDNLAIIYSEFPYYNYSPTVYYANQRLIDRFLHPIKAVNAYVKNVGDDHITLELGNIQSLPVEPVGVSWPGGKVTPPREEVICRSSTAHRPVVYTDVRFDLSTRGQTVDSLRVHYRLMGLDSLRRTYVIPWPHIDTNLSRTDIMRRPSNEGDFAFLDVAEAEKVIRIRPGRHQLRQDLIIGPGYTVRATAGTTLELYESAMILSHSPVEFRGTEKDPVAFISPDSTGQGLVVLAAGDRSVLERVLFDNLSEPAEGAWKLTGAVTFYESPVTITSTVFRNNRSEDGLNIIRSEFSIDSSLFSNCFSDAFDGDFVEGSVTNTIFHTPGNDGLDVSGSVVRLADITVVDAGDKGVSAGEDSQVEASGIDINGAVVGVAAKDLSRVTITDIALQNCRTGFAVYRKKSEFGPATIGVTGLTMTSTDTPHLIEAGSQLTIDGAPIIGDQSDVEGMIYGTSDR